MNNTAHIRTMLEMSLDDLYAEVGRDYASSQGQLLPKHPGQYVQIAKAWLSEQHEQLRVVICSSERIRQMLRESRGYDRVLLASAIVDLIAGIITGVAPATVAVLLVKEGVETLCVAEGVPHEREP